MNENLIADLVKKIAEDQVKKELGKSISTSAPNSSNIASHTTSTTASNISSVKQASSIPISAHGAAANSGFRAIKLTRDDYPLGKKHPELAKSITGKGYGDITPDNVLDGTITPEDIRISPKVLEYQAQVAESAGKKQFAGNLRRAAEMTAIPDDKVLKLYEMLRPGRSTYDELINAALELEQQYNAKATAKLLKDAAEVYKHRSVLKV